jgi:hypothetical protein
MNWGSDLANGALVEGRFDTTDCGIVGRGVASTNICSTTGCHAMQRPDHGF